MVLVIGTSLQVAPVSEIPNLFAGVPRLLINRCCLVENRRVLIIHRLLIETLLLLDATPAESWWVTLRRTQTAV